MADLPHPGRFRSPRRRASCAALLSSLVRRRPADESAWAAVQHRLFELPAAGGLPRFASCLRPAGPG